MLVNIAVLCDADFHTKCVGISIRELVTVEELLKLYDKHQTMIQRALVLGNVEA